MAYDAETLDEVITDLRAGRAQLERGWTQGDFYRDGLVCTVAAPAIGKATSLKEKAKVATTSDTYTWAPVHGALLETLVLQKQFIPGPAFIDEQLDALCGWNNRTERTQRDVIKLYDDTLERLRG